MSTLRAANLEDTAPLGIKVPAKYITQGAARHWANINGTGTPAARASLNLTSITDHGLGDYTITFTNAFASDFSFFTGTDDGGGSASIHYCGIQNTGYGLSALHFEVAIVNSITDRTNVDNAYIFTKAIGPLA